MATLRETETAQRRITFWTGKFLRDARGELVPYTITVSVDARTTGGDGVQRYLDKGFVPIDLVTEAMIEKAKRKAVLGSGVPLEQIRRHFNYEPAEKEEPSVVVKPKVRRAKRKKAVAKKRKVAE